MKSLKATVLFVVVVTALVIGLLDTGNGVQVAEGTGPVPTCPRFCK